MFEKSCEKWKETKKKREKLIVLLVVWIDRKESQINHSVKWIFKIF